MSDSNITTAPGLDADDSADSALIKQISRRLHEKHAKYVGSADASWEGASMDERKMWWHLAKSAVYVMKKNGYAKT